MFFLQDHLCNTADFKLFIGSKARGDQKWSLLLQKTPKFQQLLRTEHNNFCFQQHLCNSIQEGAESHLGTYECFWPVNISFSYFPSFQPKLNSWFWTDLRARFFLVRFSNHTKLIKKLMKHVLSWWFWQCQSYFGKLLFPQTLLKKQLYQSPGSYDTYQRIQKKGNEGKDMWNK